MMNARRAVRAALPADPRVRRAYFDCRYGQLHVNYAIPGGGGFDEATPLLCIPGAPGVGRFFLPLLLPLGRDRSVYAPDLPGCGASDPPTGPVGSDDIAHALFDFLDSMRLRTIDVLAYEDGVNVALALVKMRPQHIGRLVFSPSSEAMQEEARSLRHATLVIDWPAADGPLRLSADFEQQAAHLRDFLGLA